MLLPQWTDTEWGPFALVNRPMLLIMLAKMALFIFILHPGLAQWSNSLENALIQRVD